VKAQWEASPAIQARMKALGLPDEHALQSYFIQRIEKHLNAKGRRLIGWDEILEGGLAPNATVMSWRGLDGAVAAAKQGHDTVLAPGPVLYFDHRQSLSADEPPGRGKLSTLKSVYAFDAEPTELTPEQHKHVLGVQATMFSEHIRTDDRAVAMLFPRLAALAENAWTPRGNQSWESFVDRLPATLGRLSDLGLAYDPRTVRAAGVLRRAGGDDRCSARHGAAGGPGAFHDRRQRADARLAPLSGATGVEAGCSTAGSNLLGPVSTGPRSHLGDYARDRADAPLAPAVALHRGPDPEPRRRWGNEKGERGTFMLDILNPCWIWKDADLTDGPS
jgi:hexosaminidase